MPTRSAELIGGTEPADATERRFALSRADRLALYLLLTAADCHRTRGDLESPALSPKRPVAGGLCHRAPGQDDGVPLLLRPSTPCSFCDYLAGSRPYTILERSELTALLVTYEQRGRGHVLVIPVEHRETILNLTPAEQAAVMADVVRATRAIVAAFDPEGVAVWQNNGIPAHQSVPHVHVHVAGTLPEGGTSWGAVDQLPLAQTDAIADHLRAYLGQ